VWGANPELWERRAKPSCFENNYFTEMSSGSEAGSYIKLINFVYHSTLGLRVLKEKKKVPGVMGAAGEAKLLYKRPHHRVRQPPFAARKSTLGKSTLGKSTLGKLTSAKSALGKST